MINLLFEALPDAVEVSGKFYKIATDFRDWISFFDMLENSSIDRKQKILFALQWFTDEIPENILTAYNALIEFASCSEIHQDKPENNSENQKNTQNPSLSWLYDSVYVLGAFRQIYNIDLINIEYMHWWEFSALFEALPEDVPIKKRMAYRQINPSEIKDKERRKQILKIKRAVAFPHKPVSAEKTGEVFSMF